MKALHSTLSAVEVDGCQVSRPLRGLQWLYSDCLCAQHDDRGGTWHVKLDVGGEFATGCVARIWRRTTACWAMSSLPGRTTPSSLTAAALGPARAHGEAWNRAVNYSQKWMGASRLVRAGPPSGSPGWQLYLIAHWTLCWGPAWDWKGSTYVEAQKWMGAMRQERAEPHRQFTGTDDFNAHCYLNCDPRGHHQGRQHARTILVMTWRYWTVWKSSRIDFPGPHQAV